MVALDFWVVLAEWPLLLRGVGMTVGLTVVAAVLGAALGVACAWARLHGGPVLRATAGGYVELIRNTPFIVQLFLLYFGLPGLGLRLSPEVASVLAMVLNLGAYAGEIVRSGLEGTPTGQIEAARSLALTDLQVFTRIVLPPALGRVWPAMVGQIVIVMLGSAVCGQIATAELTKAGSMITNATFRPFTVYACVALMYFALCFPLSLWSRALERKLQRVH